MKVKDIPILKQRLLDMLPITQADMWKALGINHRDGSQLVSIMMKENLVKKTKADKTYLLESVNGHEKKEKKKKKTGFSALLSKDKFAPCCGCEVECDPTYCQKLTDWIMMDD